MRATPTFAFALASILAFGTSSLAATPPAAVKSTSDNIEQYSPQSRALTMQQLCDLLTEKNYETDGKSDLTCSSHPGNLIEFKGDVVGQTSESIFANKTDVTIYEAFGDNDIHRYMNDLGQYLSVELIAVNTAVVKSPRGPEVKGFFRLDATVSTGKAWLRVGYFSNLQR